MKYLNINPILFMKCVIKTLDNFRDFLEYKNNMNKVNSSFKN